MAERTYPVPRQLAAAFGVTAGGSVRERVIRRVAAASGDPGAVEWARGVCRRIDASRNSVLTAAGVPEMAGCRYYGILDPTQVDPVVFAVVRDDPAAPADDAYSRWTGAGWERIAPAIEPVGAKYAELDDDLLRDSLETLASGSAGLVLRPTTPRAWVPRRTAVLAAGIVEKAPGGQVFAIVDDYDTTAVLDLIRVSPGPKVERRVGGQWVADTSVLSRLKSVDPPAVVAVPAASQEDVIAQVDEFDAEKGDVAPEPVTAAGGQPDFSDGVMIALRVPIETARQVAIPGGLDPEEMHITLAYLGDEGALPVEPMDLVAAIAPVVAASGPLEGSLGGLGQFPAGPDGTPFYAPADVPGLAALRTRIVEAIQAEPLIATALHTEHDFTPHVTLGYDVNTRPVAPTPVRFDSVAVVVGPREVRIPLGVVLADGAEVEWDEAKYERAGGKFAPKAAPGASEVSPGPPGAGQPPEADEGPQKASKEAAAADEDTAFDIELAQEDLVETRTRDQFNSKIAEEYAAAGDDSDAKEAVAEKARAEGLRRAEYDKQRKYKIEAERIRRMEVKRELGIAAAGKVATTFMPPNLLKYWTRGEGALKIRWGTGGDFNRCRKQLAKYLEPQQISGACANLHRVATGQWPGRGREH